MNKSDKERVASLVISLFRMRHDHGNPGTCHPGSFPHTPEEHQSYAYCMAIQDCFLALKMHGFIEDFRIEEGTARLKGEQTKTTRPVPQFNPAAGSETHLKGLKELARQKVRQGHSFNGCKRE